MDWLRDRYPELYADQEPRRSMAQVDLVLTLGYRTQEHRAGAFFTLAGDTAPDFASRMHPNETLRRSASSPRGTMLRMSEC